MRLTFLLITSILLSNCATKIIVHDCNPVVSAVDSPNDWVCEKYWYTR